jgi:threonylcarbamoyladenosine tRNA methylthiotransferase MtaB
MSDHPRIVPHLHLCLQSGSDAVLRRMKRRYTARGFLERCARLRQALDRPAFTTDIIVGFPGETDADFEATLNVARDVGFTKIHVFSYSPRDGTPAAALPDRVPPQVVHERRERIRELERELAEKYCRGLLGQRLDVLVEGEDLRRPGLVTGTSCRYVPVSFRGFAPALVGRLAAVIAEEVRDSVIVGRPLSEGALSKGRLFEDDVAAAPLPHRVTRMALPLL